MTTSKDASNYSRDHSIQHEMQMRIENSDMLAEKQTSLLAFKHMIERAALLGGSVRSHDQE